MMGVFLRSAIAAALVGVGLAVPARAEIGPADGAALAGALAAAERGDWAGADAAAAAAKDKAGREVIQWLRLADGAGTWGEYVNFLRTHPEWPRRSEIRAEAERIMPEGLPGPEVRRFFAEEPPTTGSGALRLHDALDAAGERTRADDAVIAAWSGFVLTPAEFAAITARFPELVAKWAPVRLDNMIWRGEFGQAEAVMPLVTADQQALARARIALRQDAKGIDGFVEAVPAKLLNDPGLAYDRFQWRVRKERWAEATDLLLQQSKSAVALGRPDAWAERRLSLAHRAMREGNPKRAYRIAAEHFLDGGDNYEELEWFAGWLALRKLDDPARALVHFRNFQARVDTPISLGRAGYWVGRASEALGETRAAEAAYAEAARWQTSFYGQLAAERAGIAADPALAGPPAAPDWRRAAFMARPSGRAALMLHYADEAGRYWQMMTSLARRETEPGELAAMAQMALELGRPHVAVRIAKIAAGKGIIMMAPYYPVTELAGQSDAVAPEMALAIARQESELNPEAVSPAGARGLMQLMPATARKVAGSLGIDYSVDRLTSDWRYNVQLGQTYLRGLIDEFGSLPLAAAGYNAGPNRVDSWLAEFGDPRGRSLDRMVDWIETIPFYETRNYVMRVMEALHVYRARLSGTAQPLQLSRDLGVKG